MSSLEPPPTVYHHTAVAQFAGWRDVFVQRWSGEGGIADVRVLERAQREFTGTLRGGKCVMVSLVEATTIRPPDDQTRALIRATIDQIAPHAGAPATVLTSTGFAASVLRGLLSGLMLAQRQPHPAKVFATIDEAATFLAPLRRPAAGAPAETARALAIALHALRDALVTSAR
jgi:hypothetical protein